ncbi:MAG: hypothetical protein KC474_05470 [Cyanobacteria bacterium HKST-UBA04]|nr:hypothetical protein [Cyanobacteria bacterium HKST-UBA04]
MTIQALSATTVASKALAPRFGGLFIEGYKTGFGDDVVYTIRVYDQPLHQLPGSPNGRKEDDLPLDAVVFQPDTHREAVLMGHSPAIARMCTSAASAQQALNAVATMCQIAGNLRNGDTYTAPQPRQVPGAPAPNPDALDRRRQLWDESRQVFASVLRHLLNAAAVAPGTDLAAEQTPGLLQPGQHLHVNLSPDETKGGSFLPVYTVQSFPRPKDWRQIPPDTRGQQLRAIVEGGGDDGQKKTPVSGSA